MSPSFDIRYYLSGTDIAVGPGSECWQRRIPDTRSEFQGAETPHRESSISYADYFSAVRTFLLKNRMKVIRDAVLGQTGSQMSDDQIDGLHIYLEKHGEFYHPARIEVRLAHGFLTVVVNVAISEAGLQIATREYALLDQFQKAFDTHFTPAVYGTETVRTAKGGSLAFFMGEWFSGYHEFHLSVDLSDGKRKLSVWDTFNGHFFLSMEQSRDAYRKTAAILTYYYNPVTFEQIFSWHHAAGDFILKPADGDAVRMRLITVRRYAPLFEKIDNTTEAVLDALVVFFLNLSIRNRLDRLDGIGELVWSDHLAVPATVKGFVDGLEMKVRDGMVPADIVAGFKTHLKSYSETELFELAVAMTARYPAKSPELPSIRHHLNAHVSALHHAISRVVAANF